MEFTHFNGEMDSSYPSVCPKQKQFPGPIVTTPRLGFEVPLVASNAPSTSNENDSSGTSTLSLPSPTTPHHQRRHSVTYEGPQEQSNTQLEPPQQHDHSTITHSVSYDHLSELPLSMRFIHKPSRSQELFIKASDPTKANSLLNAKLSSLNVSDTENKAPNVPRTSSIDNNSDALISSSSSSLTSPQLGPEGFSNGNYKLVRKKSGELLKPSLKGISLGYFEKKRSLSLPATPTYKQVHFGGQTDIRYFKKKDKPAAISASNSPTLQSIDPTRSDDDSEEGSGGDEDDSENDDQEYHNFYLDRGDTKYPRSEQNSEEAGPLSFAALSRIPKHVEWELKLLNFPPLSYLRKIEAETPVFLEKIFLSVDRRHLLGYVAVKNLSFEKYLTVRYSLDHWNTIIEIPSSYVPDRPEVLKLNDYDRFTFKIPLNSLFNSFRISKDSAESSDDERNEHNKLGTQERVYEMCIKYYANSSEYWDNNNFKNYEIKLIKTTKGGQPPRPVGKIHEHTAKPKYSNAYLKRVKSDSQIELHKNEMIQQIEESNGKNSESDLSDEENQEENEANQEGSGEAIFLNDNSSELSDFEKNNFYLSSALLSSLHKNPDMAEEYIKNTADAKVISPSPQPAIPNPKYKEKFQSQMSGSNLLPSDVNKTGFYLIDDKMENADKEGDDARDPKILKSPHSSRSKFLNSKSYKELLDNYCFFNSGSPTDDDDHSPDGSFPRANGNGNGTSNHINQNESFNVSSFLGT